MKKVQETNNWIFEGKEIKVLEETPKGSYGFIYEITNLLTGQKYIGQKCLYSFRKKVTMVPGKGTRMKKQVTYDKLEADWQRYWGSNISLKSEIKKVGKEHFKKEILFFVNSKAQLTYYETKLLFSRGVLEPGSNYINDNILGKFYPKIFEEV